MTPQIHVETKYMCLYLEIGPVRGNKVNELTG